MKRLSKDQKQQRADLVTRLNDAAKAVRAALAAVNAEIAGKLNSGPCQRTRIHTVATGVIDNSPAPSRLVNADALDEELKFYPRRPRLKSVRPGQARHFATHTQGLFRVSFPKIPSERIRAMIENQGIIRWDACDPPAAWAGAEHPDKFNQVVMEFLKSQS